LKAAVVFGGGMNDALLFTLAAQIKLAAEVDAPGKRQSPKSSELELRF
jgi:hypothetical protein